MRVLAIYISNFLDAYHSKHLKYHWIHDPGVIFMDKTMAQFKLMGFHTKGKEETFVAGKIAVVIKILLQVFP